jgi:hypothetical protein
MERMVTDPLHPHVPRAAEDDVTCDVTLVDAMLALTPEERLRENDRMVRTIEELRNGFAAVRARDPARKAGG